MAETQLHFIKYAVEEILEYVEMGGKIEEWYQNKLSKVHSDMEGMHSYIEGEKRRTGMVREAMNQPNYSQSIKARQAKADKDKVPFDADKKPVVRAIPGKKGIEASTVKHLAKMAMQRQMKKEEVEISPVEKLNEGRPSQRHPLEDHEYHRKTNAELINIAKDAHKAAEAMKSHNTTAENKYRDQANDSATVRYFRQKSGMPTWYKKKYGHMKEEVEQISELSTKKLTQYKTAATKSASDADKAGDYEKGNKRFAGIMKATKKQFAPNCVQFKKTMEEDLEHLEEKNVPTSPEKWAQAKAQAKAKFDVYPSAYANGWAAKKYKSMGGGWKSVSEEVVNEDLRKWFDPKDPEGGWKRINSKGEAIGPCAREPGEAKPKCMSNEKRASLTKKERASAVKTKRKYDSDPDRKGSPINVSNYGKGKITEQASDAPFDPPYSNKPSTVTDKSGAVHGPMSRAKHLAKMAMKRQAERLKDKPTMKTTQESVELQESRRAEIVREAMKVAKDKKKKESNKTDSFEAEPELSTAINKTDV